MEPGAWALLASIATSSVVGVVVGAIVNRRKLGAEATQIITAAASSVVEDLTGALRRIQTENKGLIQGQARDKLEIVDLNARLVREQQDRGELEARLAKAESRIDELLAREEARVPLQRKHREWDGLAVNLIRSVIPPIHLESPPPLDVEDKPGGP